MPRIVGTYRLLKASVAADCGYYSESEFDLTAVKTYPGEILELGRTCFTRRTLPCSR